MSDPIERLLQAGFSQVVAVNGAACSLDADVSLLLAIWRYEVEEHPDVQGAWIHPYYEASQRAYMAAVRLIRSGEFPGLTLHDEIRIKPIMARLPMFSQGTNTLSYLDGCGSRFHVQIFTITPRVTPETPLLPEAKPLHCGTCRKCIIACPTNALENGIFHRERCIRNWMLVGGVVPEEIRLKMGNRLIGCDTCQRICPHNPQPCGETQQNVPILMLLEQSKAAAESLRPRIGANLTIPNRLLSQACMLAGCSGDSTYIEALTCLTSHPSDAVKTHASWAVARLQENRKTEE